MPAFSNYVLGLAALSCVNAHGILTSITGANNVTMPGLSGMHSGFHQFLVPLLIKRLVIDGTPRGCPSPNCGAEADTSIFNGNEPLGRTEGGGTVDAAKNIAIFMGTSAAPSTSSSSNEDDLFKKRQLGGGLGSLFGGGATTGATGASALTGGTGASALTGGTGASALTGGTSGGLSSLLGGGASASGSTTGGTSGGLSSLLGGSSSSSGSTDATGEKTVSTAMETAVGDTAGAGAKSGLPTANEDGTVSLNLHQVNQDGAGPFKAAIDSTSGGTDASAFEDAEVTSNVAGTQLGSLSAVTTTDFPVKVQVPQGTVCSGTSGGAKNVCIVKLQNSALAGPFGGSAAFTQTAAQRKRAIEFRRRRLARRAFKA